MSNAYNVHMILKALNRDDFFKVAKIAGYKEDMILLLILLKDILGLKMILLD